MKLEGKVAIITGAASGVGKAIAELYAKEGAHVVICDMNKEAATSTADAITKDGGHALAVEANVSKQQDIDNLFEQTLEKFGTVDIIVNNAGIMDNFVPVENITDELWDRVISVNLTSQMRMMRKAVSVFLPKESGVIVNITSAAGLFGSRAGIAYTASKHGVVGITKNVAFQYAEKGIRCNAIAPGGINTNIGTTMNAPDPFGMERVMSGSGNNPRNGDPEEIATIALFLASADSKFVNGTIITADGGWMAY